MLAPAEPARSRGPGTRVGAVLVAHDSAAELPGCVAALRAHAGGVALALVVADSGSSDDVERVARELGAQFLPGPNRGFGAAVNRALRSRALDGCEWVLVVNPDAVVVRGSVAELVDLLEGRPRCALAGVATVDDREAFVPSIGVDPTPRAWWRAARTGWGDWVWDAAVHAREQRCAWVSGAFLVLRRDAVRALGGFDERFFLYCEEVELARRARRAGWEVRYLPALTVAHRREPRTDHALYRRRMLSWSKLLYVRTQFPPLRRVAMRTGLLAFLLGQWRRRRAAGDPARGELAELIAATGWGARRYGPPPSAQR